ncbi:hypothetical protein [Devosia sp. Root635]|uniref:hypothetical protein n=1 Tax=Devosia sp. Root635 TaxID=1736575 RepID=UPI0006FD9C63|nr:hypothetical protein [Devosia sp. Root635]KRA56055.1 hypothetical protein ASD80_01950 [Devosia sp. Root635]
MAKSSRTRRAVVAATTVATLAGSAAMPAAASEIQRAYAQHTRQCIGLFFSDKAAHTAQCLPNNSATIWVEGTTGSPVVPPPVVVVPPPPPPVVVPPDSSYPRA